MNTPLIVIPARMASTRLPDKPLSDIGGAPMIVRVWQQAMAAHIAPVIVACDGKAIADAITAMGGIAIITDPDLPSGSDRVWQAVKQYDTQEKHDIIINLQGDLPTFDPELLHTLMVPMGEEAVDISTLAAPITREEERYAPSVVKPVLALAENGLHGKALYFSRASVPYGEGTLYHHIGVYAYRRDALQTFVSLPPSPLERREKLEQLRAIEHGLRIECMIVNTVPLGVDTKEDLARARSLYEQSQFK